MDLLCLRVLVLALLAAIVPPVLSQTTSQPSPIDPEILLYHAFLFRVAWFQDQADELATEGKVDSFMRSTVQREASLTAQEAVYLNTIARDWRNKDLAILTAMRARPGARAGGSSPQLKDLAGQRLQNVVSHVSQLQSALGPARFPVLDYYVHTTVAVKPGPGHAPLQP